jgi:hypothetical protein
MKGVYLSEILLNSYRETQQHIPETDKMYSHSVFIVRQTVSQTENNQIKKDETVRVCIWGNLKRIKNCARNTEVTDSLRDIGVDAE